MSIYILGLRKIIIGLGYKFVIAYIINTMWMSQDTSRNNIF